MIRTSGDWKRRGIGLAAIVILMQVVAACGGGGGASNAGQGQASASTTKQLYAQAQKEGQVVFDGPVPVEDMNPVLKQFQKQYPGVTVKYTSIGDQQIIPPVTAQETAGNVQIDLAADATTYFPTLLPYATRQNWGNYSVDKSYIDQSGKSLHWFDTPWVVVYNTKHVSAQDVPKTWQDLLDPKWGNGHIALDNAPTYADALLLSPQWGNSKTLDFAKKLSAQKPLIESRPIQVLQAVVSGQAEVGTALAQIALVAKDQGQPVEAAPVSPQSNGPVDLFTLKGAPHPAAATLLGSWLASKQARQAFDTASHFGLGTPCNAGSMAAYLCSKHIGTKWFPSYEAEAKQEPPFTKAFNNELGVAR